MIKSNHLDAENLLTNLKERQDADSELERLLQVEELSCQAMRDRVKLDPATPQIGFAYFLHAIFISYLQVPNPYSNLSNGDLIFNQGVKISNEEFEESFNTFQLSQGKSRVSEGEVPDGMSLSEAIALYTVKADLKNSDLKLSRDTFVQCDLVRPKLRKVLRLTEEEEDEIPF